MNLPKQESRELAFICDIDGTAADTTHREHLVRKAYDHLENGNGPKPDWEAFYAAQDKDPPVIACQVVVQALIAQGIKPVYMTGRPAQYMNETRRWLIQHGFCSHSGRDKVTTALFMRPDGDMCPDHELKARIYREHIRARFHVLVWLEDRDSVVRMVRQDLGLPCWQVRPGDF